MYSPKSTFSSFEGNRKADVAPGENELDTPALSLWEKRTCSMEPVRREVFRLALIGGQVT